jgi:hypothetical protein
MNNLCYGTLTAILWLTSESWFNHYQLEIPPLGHAFPLRVRCFCRTLQLPVAACLKITCMLNQSRH